KRSSSLTHWSYFAASTRLTTRASSASSLSAVEPSLPLLDASSAGETVRALVEGGVWAAAPVAREVAPTKTSTGTDRLKKPIREARPDCQGPGKRKTPPGLRVTSNPFGGSPLPGGGSKVQCARRCAPLMGRDCRLGTGNVPSSPQLALDPGAPVSSRTAFL